MALSQQTQEHIDDAKGSLRAALAYAARNERANTIMAIAELLSQCDKLATVDEILDSLDNMKFKWDQKRLDKDE